MSVEKLKAALGPQQVEHLEMQGINWTKLLQMIQTLDLSKILPAISTLVTLLPLLSEVFPSIPTPTPAPVNPTTTGISKQGDSWDRPDGEK